jgi:hypothetical protein
MYEYLTNLLFSSVKWRKKELRKGGEKDRDVDRKILRRGEGRKKDRDQRTDKQTSS